MIVSLTKNEKVYDQVLSWTNQVRTDKCVVEKEAWPLKRIPESFCAVRKNANKDRTPGNTSVKRSQKGKGVDRQVRC